MKLWYIGAAYLPDALLYRAHQSSHAVLHGIVAGVPRRGVTRFLRFGGFVALVHYWLAVEMRSRGARHESPVDALWRAIPEHRRRLDYPVTEALVRRDIAQVLAYQARPGVHVSMTRSTLPARMAGLEFLEAQRRVVAEGALPKFAFAV